MNIKISVAVISLLIIAAISAPARDIKCGFNNPVSEKLSVIFKNQPGLDCKNQE
jgi:hypothetical protein